MKKAICILIGIIVGIIVLAAIICVVVFSALNKTKNADYYDLGSDQISSVKAVLGVRNINRVSTSNNNGIITKLYEYRSNTSTEDIEQYIAYLTENEGFILTSLNNNQQVYAKESNDKGKLLLLDITNNGFGFTLTIKKGEGTLTITY